MARLEDLVQRFLGWLMTIIYDEQSIRLMNLVSKPITHTGIRPGRYLTNALSFQKT